MHEWFLKLFGIRSTGEAQIERWRVYFANIKTPFRALLFILAAAAALYVVWWFYKREPAYCSLRRRRIMASLRCAGLCVILLILAGPMLKMTLVDYIKGKVVILVDDTLSMSLKDKYRRPEDKLVAAHVLARVPLDKTVQNFDPGTEEAIAQASRMDLVKAMFHHKEMNFLEQLQQKHEVEVWRFSKDPLLQRLGTPGQKLEPSVVDQLQATGLVTEIGEALTETANRLKGQPLAGVILVSDGDNNNGEDPIMAAEHLQTHVYPVGIGVPQSRSVALAYMFMENKIFVDDPAPVHLRIKHRGFANEPAEIRVTCNGEDVGRPAIITLGEAPEQNEVIRIKPQKAGHFTFKAELRLINPAAAADDSEPANKVKSREVEVIDQKIKVLLIESEPRWEYRFLKNSLLRDKRVSCHILLHVPDLEELATPHSAYLRAFPEDTELFTYHVVIFGNVANDGFLTEKELDNLRRFVVELGGGIWFIAGKNRFPDTFKDSKLEPLIPVEFDRNPEITAESERTAPLTMPLRALLTPEGRSSSLTRLDMGAAEQSDDKNAELWDLVPDFYWCHKDNRAKLGATTLLVLGGRGAAPRGEAQGLLVSAPVGRGRVLYQAFADLWRMRFPAELGPDALERFHGHVVQYLGLTKLLGRTARVEITTDREEYSVGDNVHVTARVLEKDFQYSTASHETAVIADQETESNQFSVELTPDPSQRGMFTGQGPLRHAGRFRITIKDRDEDQAHADFTAVVPQVELDSPEMKRELLESLAKNSTRGDTLAKVYRPDQLSELLADFSVAQRPVEEPRENTLWDSPLLLILFTLFMGSEWLLRKRSDLL